MRRMDGATLTLRQALEIVGTRERLAAALGVTPADLDGYLSGRISPPGRVFLDAVDIVWPASGPRSLANRVVHPAR